MALLLAAVLALAANGVPPPPSSADVETLSPAFTGTIVSTYPDGRTSRVWLNRDGTFSSEGRVHEKKAGHWYVKRGDLCLTQSKPIPIPFLAYCSPIPAKVTGEGWSGKADTGEPIRIRLLAER